MTDSIFSFSSTANQPTGVIYPLPDITVDPRSTLIIADPTTLAIADAFTQFLNTNLQPRFSEAATGCGLIHANLDAWIDGKPVAQTIVFPLNEELLKVNEFRFPLLAIQPDSEEFTNWTLTSVATVRNYSVAYIFPPLNSQQYNAMYPFLPLAAKTLLAYGVQGYDPKVSTVSAWQTAGLAFGLFEGVSYEPYKGANAAKDKSYFPTMEMKVSFAERNQNPVPGNQQSFSGISTLQEDLYDGYNIANPIINFIDGYVYPNISLSSCSPATGTVQGNTLVVIQGVGFEAAKITSVVLDGSPAKNFTVKSPTVILAITSAATGFPNPTGSVGPVVLTDNQNNQYSLPSGYAYSTP